MATRKLIVEICSAHNLMPKDGQGSSSPYVLVDYDGQRRRTKTKDKDLNPVWDEKVEFLVSKPNEMADESLEVNVYNEKKNAKRSNFLGRVRISGRSVVKKGEEELMYYALEKRGLFSHIKGQLGLKVYYIDEVPKPAEPEKKADEKPAEKPAAPAAEKAADPPSETPVEGKPAATEEKKEEKKDEKVEEKKAETKEEKKGEEKKEEKKGEEKKDEEKPAEKKKEKAKGEEKVVVHAAPIVAADYSLKDTSPSLGAIYGERVSTYDLVEKMQYVYVRVVKARNLAAKDVTGSSDPYVRVTIGSHTTRTRTIAKNLNPEWNQVFAFGKEKLQAQILEITVWDEDIGKKDDFLGVVSFDLQEIPKRVPPDSPLAPQWYRLEEMKGEGRVKGDVMLSVWIGTQADEAFPDAWQSDTGGESHTRSKVYLSPKLWYLRVNVIEAQDLQPSEKTRYPEVSVTAQLGFQQEHTTLAKNRTNSPFWNEDLLFVAAEPFDEHLLLVVTDQVNREKYENLGQAKISLSTVERRLDHRQVSSRWCNLEKPNGENGKFRGRIHLRICFDGGYHVMDEAAHLCSDLRPTAKQLWKAPLGVLELGVLGAQNLLPMKTKDGRGSTDAYCVAKYGQKWVRTRTIMDSFNPRWNEQYTWEVYDPCTVLSVGVFHNAHLRNDVGGEKANGAKDMKVGKVRIRLSTLDTERVYTNSYPLLVLHPSGAKKMGELELAVRFSSFSLLNMLHMYTQPQLPKMHYLYPLGISQQDRLRAKATKMVVLRMARSEPPLRQEVLQYMLDTESNRWSMRRSKANWFRIMSVVSGLAAVIRWLEDIRQWRNVLTTVLLHILFLILLFYPELILPTIFLYMFLIGLWHYRFRPRTPPHMDARISHADAVAPEELDEEFDTLPTSKPPEVVKYRYDKLKALAGRIQAVLGDLATQGERILALLSWRDPRATFIFLIFCLVSTILLYVTPIRVVIALLGLYFLRHPRFRHRNPPLALNFFRRLPALSDRIL